MAYSGAAGYEVLTSANQRDRMFHVDLDSGLGHKPFVVPQYLSRVLYVPQHSMLNLTLYEATEQYQQAIETSPTGADSAVAKALMGNRLYKTRLNTIERPHTTKSAFAQYVIQLNVEKIRDGGDISATVRQDVAAEEFGLEIDMVLPMLRDVFSLSIPSNDVSSRVIDISTTYPLPRLTTNAGYLHFPYFRFSLPDEPVQYEWQIHPLDHGTLRYTLFRIADTALIPGSQPSTSGDDSNVVAIYHHLGHDGSLFLPTSEGVLLLSGEEGQSSLLEAVTVASLIGLLWRIRGMEIKEKTYKKDGKNRRTLMQRVFGGRK